MPTAKDIVVRKPTQEETPAVQELADLDVRAQHVRLVVHGEGDLPDPGGGSHRLGRQGIRELRPGRSGHLPAGPRLHLERREGGAQALQLRVEKEHTDLHRPTRTATDNSQRSRVRVRLWRSVSVREGRAFIYASNSSGLNSSRRPASAASLTFRTVTAVS